MMRRLFLLAMCFLAILGVLGYHALENGWLYPSSSNTTVTPPIILGETDHLSDPEHLAKTDPVKLLEQSLTRYRDAIKSYTCVLTKRERIQGKLRPREVIDVAFQEDPFSVLMVWKEGRDEAAASLFALPLSDKTMFVRPAGRFSKIVGTVELPPDCSKAAASARYLINDFGIRKGTERTHSAWKKIHEKNLMNFEYLGLQQCELTGNRDCHVVTRHCDPATEDDPREREEGLTEVTLHFDAETWLVVGTVLKAKDELIGEYFFRDIKINPPLDQSKFSREHLKTID